MQEWHAKGDAGTRWGKESGSSLTRSFASQNHSITFLGSCAHSLFGEPLQFMSGIVRKNLKLFMY